MASLGTALITLATSSSLESILYKYQPVQEVRNCGFLKMTAVAVLFCRRRVGQVKPQQGISLRPQDSLFEKIGGSFRHEIFHTAMGAVTDKDRVGCRIKKLEYQLPVDSDSYKNTKLLHT